MGMGTRTPGPMHLFSRFRGNSAVYYLGTCVAAPEPEHEKSRIPIMNDIAGRNEPFQIVKDGENALVMATMNRFDWLLLQTIRGLDSTNTVPANPLSGNSNAGSEEGFTRGTLVIGLTDFQLIILNEYAGTAGASGTVNDQTPIRTYFSVEMVKYKESTVGTRVLEVACAFRAVSTYNYLTLNFAGGTGNAAGGLYSDDTTRSGTTVAALRALIAAAGG